MRIALSQIVADPTRPDPGPGTNLTTIKTMTENLR
jgi:hypothetical protein